MEKKKIMLLGGYGNTGRQLAHLLLKESDAALVVAGRNLTQANQFCGELNHLYPGERAQALCVDAADPGGLRQSFESLNLVVVASSTARYARQVAAAALSSGVDYLDIQYSTDKVAVLRSMAGDIEKAGRCFITDGGFHPGLPALLVRYVALSFDQIQSARVGSVIKEDWKSLQVEDSTVEELVELLNDFKMLTYSAGRWKKASLVSTRDFIQMDFGGPFGRQYCAPLLLEEMLALPEIYPTLSDTGFYVGGFNWFTDWVIMPIAMLAMKLSPQAALKPMGRWMHWGLNAFSKPPYGTLLRVEATGSKDGSIKHVAITVSHPDGYAFTAIPAVACLLQYLDGSINKPGLFLQALVVEPSRFMSDMQRMGITVRQE